MTDTIYALSSGMPPAAIGVIRISGPDARSAIGQMCGEIPAPRRPSLRTLRNDNRQPLDSAFVLWLPGPSTATGEDLAEIHCHGGRAVIAAILSHLQTFEGLREAEAGEFTRRAFANGRIDLAEAEGLADLLTAETEFQRRSAIQTAGGELSKRIEGWRERVLSFAAAIEAVIDFSDEDDVGDLSNEFYSGIEDLVAEIRRVADRPATERLRDGVKVVLAGPPNAGKSSLFNTLLSDDAAIVTSEAGTTRDVLERPVSIKGVPFVLVDTAGIRENGAGAIETIGIERARQEIVAGQIVLWLGASKQAPQGSMQIHAKSDLQSVDGVGLKVSAVTGSGIDDLIDELVRRARDVLPPADSLALNRRQKECAFAAADALVSIERGQELLIVAEVLRSARRELDRIIGRDSTEEMLDALFGRFCIGK